MIEAGYFAKRIVSTPEWLGTERVREICSVAHCIALAPAGWIDAWRHNGFGWFDHAADAWAVVPRDELSSFRLYAYRVHDEIFHAGTRQPFVLPAAIAPDPVPPSYRSLGFDAVVRTTELVQGFECSPLSCNRMAAEMDTNEHCLFKSLDDAIAGALKFSQGQHVEPGDYFVVEVLTEAPALNDAPVRR